MLRLLAYIAGLAVLGAPGVIFFRLPGVVAAVDRALLACALDRLTILSAAGNSRVADLFARAELKRSFRARRNPILAATPEGRKRAPEPQFVKLRGHRLQ